MPLSSRRLRQRNRRVQSHLTLVHSIARHYAACTAEPLDDLLQVGRLGLIRAAELYNGRRQVPFSAFARPHIRGAVLHYLRDLVPLIRPSRRQHERELLLKRHAQEADAAQPMLITLRRVPLPTLESMPALDCGTWDSHVESDQLLEALNSLDPRLRGVVQAVVLRGESLRAVAQHHGVSAATVHRHLHQALACLRAQLTPASGAPAC